MLIIKVQSGIFSYSTPLKSILLTGISQFCLPEIERKTKEIRTKNINRRNLKWVGGRNFSVTREIKDEWLVLIEKSIKPLGGVQDQMERFLTISILFQLFHDYVLNQKCLKLGKYFDDVSLNFVGRLTLSSSLVSVVCDKKVSRVSGITTVCWRRDTIACM